ncbi:MAG: metallophosphoesterase, partial [Cyclobacteriaceae bacterium]
MWRFVTSMDFEMLASKIKNHLLFLLLPILVLGVSCGNENGDIIIDRPDKEIKQLSIFFINDPHARLTNFAKIKHIVDVAKEETNTLLVVAGDIFSGSPYVDQYDPKGYPMIDVMNQTGFDVGALGNHEFDYGLEVLEDRIEQSTFPWLCANVDTKTSALSQPDPYISLTIGGVKVTFLGLVETGGHPTKVIPATHPWRVTDISFQRYSEVAGDYSTLKKDEGADVLVALTHLGLFSDQQLATNFPYFDLIIGGHSNNRSTESINGIPTLMAGNNLSHLGRVDIEIANDKVTILKSELI